MYPLQRKGELDHYRIPYIPCQPDKSHHHLISTQNNSINNLPVTTSGKRPRAELRLSEIQDRKSDTIDNGTSSENKVRRIMHRDIERQRRQEMASLYASLRSLLPLEYIKGKRAVADHMHQAVNYIKHLQNNIDELRSRRDKLIKKPNSSTGSSDDINGAGVSPNYYSSTVTVNPCQDGIEILIGSSLKEEVFPLSRVLKKLLEGGINVVSCISTKSSETAMHRILTQVKDPKCIDMRALQLKLANAINCQSD